MSKYPLHPDLARIGKLNPPMNRIVLVLGNACLRLPLCRKYRGIRLKKRSISGYGRRIGLHIYAPKDLKGTAPCLVYFHGGGFAMRAAPQHYKLAQVYAEEARCRVVLVDYSLAPFPAPAEDCFAAYKWVMQNAHKLHIDPARIAVGGDSAGGALAAAVCLMARDRKCPAPCFQMLVYPVTDRAMSTRSMADFRDTPMWNTCKNEIMWQRYLRRPFETPIEYASPMDANSLEELPDAYVETAEYDCLRDEGAAYAVRLQQSGSRVELNMTKGTVHGFELKWKAGPTQSAIDRRVEALRNAFGLSQATS